MLVLNGDDRPRVTTIIKYNNNNNNNMIVAVAPYTLVSKTIFHAFLDESLSF